MQIVAGTDFTPADMFKLYTADSLGHYKNVFIMNESAAKAIGWKPEQGYWKNHHKKVCRET